MFNPFTRRRKTRRPRRTRSSQHFTLSSETKRGIVVVILFTISFFSVLSFFHATGSAGERITSLLGTLFGWADWIVPLLLATLAYFLIRPNTYTIKLINYVGFVLIVLGSTGLLHLSVRNVPLGEIAKYGKGGGYIGYFAANFLYEKTEFTGALLILLALLLVGIFIFFNSSFTLLASVWSNSKDRLSGLSLRRSPDNTVSIEPSFDENIDDTQIDENIDDDEEAGLEDDVVPEEENDVHDNTVDSEHLPRKKRVFPKIDIPLDLLTAKTDTPAAGDIKVNMKRIEETLKSFGIDVTMGEVNVGPTVTQYTLKPVEGIKLNQITALHSDLALALAAHPIRIEAPIPRKSLVGIEVPNSVNSIVRIRSILESSSYTDRKSNLMLALGKDVSGNAIMADLAKMPHILIAGATGSGKSVSINCMITSLLYQNSPDILKLILVDPKRVELTNYDDIPHLVTPVITDVNKTVNALRWAVHQMDERYKLLEAAKKKNIEAFNSARLMDKMPYIVIIIDELADLMMVAPKEVESAIIRLAQMARAVGIHLIIATQRPSVNVITGLIKANITSRIAFAVASLTDSRTILDSSGAEKLLGNGDMLYTSAQLSSPKRIQGALISDREINAVCDYLRERGEPDYDASVIERRNNRAGITEGYDGDDEEDVEEAARVVVKAKRASATLLQSRMRIGFAKASRILDALEQSGIIGPQNSSKAREVLVTQEELDTKFSGHSSADDLSEDEYETDAEDASDDINDEGDQNDEDTDEDDEHIYS